MTRMRSVRAMAVAVVLLAAGGAGCAPVAGTALPSTTGDGPSTTAVGPTDDMLDPAVTQATIGATICLRGGYTASVRPPTTYTEGLKRHQITSYGYADRRLGSYEEDHVVSLELGGAPRAVANLFPEPHTVSSLDDTVEDDLHGRVCAGTLSLADARARIFAAKVAHGYDRSKSTA